MRNVQGLEINSGRLLLLYFMRPPDLNAMCDAKKALPLNY